MPKGPQGQKRPADAIARAVMVAKIATGEVEEETADPSTEANRRGGLKSLRVSPAMAAGITDRLWSMEDIIAKIDEMAPAPKPRGPYKKRS